MSAFPHFDELIGQAEVKSQLQFYIQSSRANGGVMPHILYGGSKGMGKTNFARAAAASLRKPLAEVNCGSIKNAKQFFESFVLNVVHDKDVTVLLDECHHLPKDVVTSLLTILNTEKGTRKDFVYQDYTFEFDFKRQSFMFATTETDKVFGPLRDRLKFVDFKQYTHDELKQIIKKRSGAIKYQAGVLTELADVTRGNPRSAVLMVDDVKAYCNIKNSDEFGVAAWEDLQARLGILPLGLTKSEAEVLRILNEGACTLQMLAAKTGSSRQTIQRDVENFLMRKSLMRIEGLRHITPRGQDVLKLIDSK